MQGKTDFKNTLRQGLIIFILLTPVASIIQYFLYPNLRNLQYLGWDPHLYRLFGLFFDTSVAGAIYALLFLLIFLSGKKLMKNDILRNFLLVTFMIFSVLTYSRSLYLALPVVVSLYFIAKKQYVLPAVFFISFLIFISLSPKPFGEGVNLGRTFSIESRFNDYQLAFKLWKKNPLFGIGYNRIRYVKNELVNHAGASLHSSFLIVLVTGGMAGLILFLFALLKIASLSEYSHYAMVLLGLLSFADNILLHPFVLLLLFSTSAYSIIRPFGTSQ
ncbi:O-antigen ligase family protein [Candidatus Roizmanbacteria bacterium]|nr:O-antigen ligase family protein [Candidatus Roizmanbacteria bacterium]